MYREAVDQAQAEEADREARSKSPARSPSNRGKYRDIKPLNFRFILSSSNLPSHGLENGVQDVSESVLRISSRPRVDSAAGASRLTDMVL
jgi:hypothetical protein